MDYQYLDQNFTQSYFQQGRNTNIRNDSCTDSQRSKDNNQAFKYYTTSNRDLLDAQLKKNFFSIDTRDTLFVPSSDRIDSNSQLRQGKLTQCRNRQGLGQLPFPTLPARFQSNHNNQRLDVEYDLINQSYDDNLKRRSLRPQDTKFYNRTFAIFAPGDEPNPLASVETIRRGGVPTRFDDRDW